ncbi:MAG TPA: hypothetical protein VK978_00850 [Candidatus Saccharimonadales bacterium]|nr:hypothetical protein [Candidatus Saccharimonadales bacterium]
MSAAPFGIIALLEHENKITADRLWKVESCGVRFAPDPDLLRNITVRISDFGCEDLTRFIEYSNVSPKELAEAIRIPDFDTFHDMWLATALQVVLIKLQRRYPACHLIR